VGDGVVAVGRVRDAREQSRLAGVQVLGVLREVVLCAGLHAVLRGPELGDVEIGVEDLVLAPALLQRDRELRLAQLAAVALLRRLRLRLLVVALLGVHEQRVLHVLLREGRAALGGAGGGIVREGADRAREVHAAVLVEPVVLDVDDGVLDVRRDLVERDHDAVLAVERREQRPVGRLDTAGLVQRLGLELRREGVEEVHAVLRDGGAHRHRGQEEGGQQHAGDAGDGEHPQQQHQRAQRGSGHGGSARRRRRGRLGAEVPERSGVTVSHGNTVRPMAGADHEARPSRCTSPCPHRWMEASSAPDVPSPIPDLRDPGQGGIGAPVPISIR
jgi:hypothetical protein